MDPEDFLPLTPLVFTVLLALADGEQHGYRIMRDVAERSGERRPLHAGTLYRTLARLLESGLIEERGDHPARDADDERRRYYRLTPMGIRVARAEVARLDAQLATARQRRLLDEGPA